MRAVLLAPALLFALLLGGSVLGFGTARAQESHEDPSAKREEQIARIRQLPPEEKQRLRQALERFRSLPAAEQQALRAKAREVGAERLGELAGHDIAKLRRKHQVLQREMSEVWRLLGAPDRVRGLTPEERAYLEERALRGFQVFLRQQTFEAANVTVADRLSPRERREALARGTDVVVKKLLEELEEKTPGEAARFRSLAPIEQRRERAKLLAEWRIRQTVAFTKRFDAQVLYRFLELPPEGRRQFIARRMRWIQLGSVLRADGVSQAAMSALAQLRPEERAQVAAFYDEKLRDLPPSDRRARIEEKIQEFYGRSAIEDPLPQRPLSRVRDLLRQRALRERAAGETPVPPPTK